MMNKLKFWVVSLLIAGIAGLLMWQQQQTRRLRDEIASLHQELEKAAGLEQANHHLAEELNAAEERSKANRGELSRLRAQSGRVRQLEQQNAQLKGSQDPLTQAAIQTYRDIQAGTGMSAEEMAQFGKSLPEVHERVGLETAALIGLRALQFLNAADQQNLERFLARSAGNYYQAYRTNRGDEIIARIEGSAKTNAAIAAAISTREQ
jgi:hypothetical protein